MYMVTLQQIEKCFVVILARLPRNMVTQSGYKSDPLSFSTKWKRRVLTLRTATWKASDEWWLHDDDDDHDDVHHESLIFWYHGWCCSSNSSPVHHLWPWVMSDIPWGMATKCYQSAGWWGSLRGAHRRLVRVTCGVTVWPASALIESGGPNCSQYLPTSKALIEHDIWAWSKNYGPLLGGCNHQI